jgi:hypothetical protein
MKNSMACSKNNIYVTFDRLFVKKKEKRGKNNKKKSPIQSCDRFCDVLE